MNTVRLGIYRYFKGKEYKVIGEAIHSETGEKFVIYHPIEEETL